MPELRDWLITAATDAAAPAAAAGCVLGIVSYRECRSLVLQTQSWEAPESGQPIRGQAETAAAAGGLAPVQEQGAKTEGWKAPESGQL